MKKKALILLFVVVVVVLGYLYMRPPEPVLSISRVYDVSEVGSTVLVNVTLNNVPSCAGWALRLDWDPYVAKLTTGGADSLTEGPFLKDQGKTLFVVNSADNKIGETAVSAFYSTMGSVASGTGVILSINFTIVHLGTTAIESNPPSPAYTQAMINGAGSSSELVGHIEINGLITEKGPPPVWASADFENTLIAGELAVLLAASGIVYWRTHPRLRKSERRKAELQPVIDREDNLGSN